MKVLTRRILGVAAFALLACPAFAQDLSGTYIAQGRNPDGSPYGATVQMTHSGDLVSMAWRSGDRGYTGTGVIDGRVITVNWGADTPIFYVVMPDGSLHGTWADGAALEKLTRN